MQYEMYIFSEIAFPALTKPMSCGIIFKSKQKLPLLTLRHCQLGSHILLLGGFLRPGMCWSGALMASVFFYSCKTIQEVCPINDLMINEEIREREVRVVNQNGEQLGIMPTAQALELAEQQELDLVNIAPNAHPPVCKLMDYGKYRFEMSKKEREIKKNQKVMETKGIQLSATIEDHDIDVKFRQAVKFLKDGNKLKVTIRFRGRQIAHSEIGQQVMQEFAERIKDYGTVERRPMLEGRQMTMMVGPRDTKKE